MSPLVPVDELSCQKASGNVLKEDKVVLHRSPNKHEDVVVVETLGFQTVVGNFEEEVSNGLEMATNLDYEDHHTF